MTAERDKFVTPDYHKTNGFGREYVERQLDGEHSDFALRMLRNDLADFMAIDAEADIFDIRSPWLKRSLAKVASGNVDQILVAKDKTSYLIGDRQFENVLQAHHYEMARKSKELLPTFESYKSEFRSRLEDLVTDGELPKEAVHQLSALDQVNFVVGDNYTEAPILARVERGDRDEERPEADIITYPLAFDYPWSDVKSTTFHELVHVIHDNNAQALHKLLNEVLPDIRAIPDIENPLEEALTETIAQIILGKRSMGEIPITYENPLVYVYQRRFLDDIAVLDEKPGETTRALVSAYFGKPVDQALTAKIRELLKNSLNLNHYFSLSDYDAWDKIFEGAGTNKSA